MKTKFKKAMSPLVATVLLIAFAISLGVVVMSFGSTYYENSRFSPREVNATALCEDVSLEILQVQEAEQLCHGGSATSGFVQYILVNKANMPIESLQIWIVGDSIFVTDITQQTLQPGQPLQGTVAYDYERYGTIRQIQLIPRIRIPESEELLFCFDQAVKVDQVQKCPE